jgi:hypothetical protein
MPCDQHEMTLPVLADGIEHLKAFHIGQAVIEHHHIGREIIGFSDSFRTVVGNPDFQCLRLQVTLEVLRQQLFVINNQYFIQQGGLLETAGPDFEPDGVRVLTGLTHTSCQAGHR